MTSRKTKCVSPSLGSYTDIPSGSEIEVSIVVDDMMNPEISGNVCRIINVDRCHVVYPSGILGPL